MPKEFKISRAQFKTIHDMTCSNWKSEIVEMTRETIGAFANEGLISLDKVESMFKAASASQKAELVKIFPEYEKQQFEKFQLVWAWDDVDEAQRCLCVWDEEDCFDYEGFAIECSFNHYEAYQNAIEPWMTKMQDACKNKSRE